MLRIIATLFFILPSIMLGQYNIEGTFSPAKDYNFALLYKVTPTISEYITNVNIKEDGSFKIELDSTATKGMYRLVYAVPQEDYNFDIIYNAKEDISLTFNSETGVKFHFSIENRLLESYTNSMSMITHSIGKFFGEQSKDTTALSKIFKTQRETQLRYEEAAKNNLAFPFIRANRPYIPNGFQDVNTYIGNLKKHYFDYVDFNDKALQSSTLLEEKMLNYVFGMSDDSVDEITNYKNNIDVFYKVLKPTSNDVKRILLVDLWQQMADLNLESVANYISEKYLMNIAVALNDQKLLNDLIQFKNISLGNIAPDFSMEVEIDEKKATKKLSKLDVAENYIIVFWSSTCSHCLDEIPQLKTFANTFEKEKLKVIAIALEDEVYTWKSMTYDYPDFIHVYGKGKWDNAIGNAYGVTATPTYFVLNKNKEIISKPSDFQGLKTFFDKATQK